MDVKVPKLILKVEFIEGFNVSISLISIDDYYNTNIAGSKIHTVPDNDFIIFEGSVFKIDDGLVSLPDENCTSINQSTIKFVNEKRRYHTLYDLKDALLHWSASKYWKGNDKFSKVPQIEYRKNLWILY